MVNKEEQKILNLVKILPVLIIIFSILVTYIVISDNTTKFELEINKLQIDSTNEKKELLKNEVQRVYQFIKNEENDAITKIKFNIKEKVYEAHTIASSIYKNNKNKSKKEITKLIKDALRDIRFNNKRGYFFIYETTGNTVLHPILPNTEGINLWNFKDVKGNYVIRKLSEMVKNKKEGFLTWWWTKPDDKRTEYQKIGFSKYFAPYNWFIGTGEYVEDYKKVLKNSLLRRIDKIKYGKNGYFFIVDEKGVYLSHYKKAYIGKNRINLRDTNGFLITKEIINTGQKKDGGFISYIGTIKPSTGKASKKISFILGYKPWEWAIGTGAYLSDINEMILKKRKKLEEKNKEQIIKIFIICFLISIILFVISIVFSNIIKNKFEHYKKNVNKKANELRELNKTLEQKVEKRTQALSHQTRKVTDLLNNAAQGFLSFDKNFLIGDEYSLECEYLLGKNLENKDITGLLFNNYSKKIPFFKETMIDALNSKNELTSSLLLSLLPSELIINKHAVLIDYKIISNKKFMIILTNITDKKKLQTKIRKEQRIHKMIVSVVSDNMQFFDLKRNFENFCENIVLNINLDNSIKENLNALIALVHTFKGLFAQLYMEKTVKNLHNVESKILNFIDNKNNSDVLKDFINSIDIRDCMNDDLKTIVQTLGDDFMNENTQIKVDEEFITYIESKIVSLCSLSITQKQECEEILNTIQKIRYKPLKHHLSIHPKLCQQLCLSLNKSIYDFEINGSMELYISNKYKAFINSLVHVFRNCCDHGIETKEDRISLNKDETGSITCSFETKNNILYIKITDDGKGIDIDALKKKIIQKRLIAIEDVKLLSENEILNFIFHNNFSTNETITHISGRGIGLSAVKIELDKLYGDINIKTELNKGTSFIFKLPFKSI